MRLWLMQHGLAEDEAADPERPLTTEGRDQVEAVACVLAGLDERPARIVHSTKLRAGQTAAIVGAALGMPAEHMLGLHPNDVAEPWVPRVSAEELLIVGHLPFLGRLAALLLDGDVVRFTPAGVLRFEHEAGWKLLWELTPALAEACR